MVPFLYTPREHRSVATPEAYRADHVAFMARKVLAGGRFVVHEVVDPIKARVDANSWLIDCECGAGNSTDPDWGFACCYGCGAIHTNVRFPDDVDLITQLLIARADVPRRGWDIAGMLDRRTGQTRKVDQTLVELVAENVSVQANVPETVIDAIVNAVPSVQV
jgi:hypothetical protein